MVDDFSDVSFTISRKLAHYAKSCCRMMSLRYREDHEFFIRCMQYLIEYRVRGETAGGVISSNDDVLIGGLIHEDSEPFDTSPMTQYSQQLNLKQVFHHQYPCSEYMVAKSEEGLTPVAIQNNNKTQSVAEILKDVSEGCNLLC